MPPLRAFLLSMVLAQPLAAGDWKVLVIGNPSKSAPTAFADAHTAAETFRRLDLGSVALRREIGADALAQALDDLTGAPRVILYFAGPIGAGAAGPQMMGQGGGDARGAIGPLISQLAAAGTTELVLLIEDCAGPTGLPGRLQPPQLPAGLSVFIAASAGTATACPDPSLRLTSRLAQAGDDTLQDALSGLWSGGTTLAPLALAAAPATEAPADTIGVVEADVVSVIPVAASPAPAAEVIYATDVSPEVETEASSAAGLTAEPAVFAPVRSSDLMAIPVAAGMPKPSIIVGLLQPEAPPQPTIAFDDIAAREALRKSDPAQYQRLVEAGELDPPADRLAVALQTELQRAGCYRGTIDGQWGAGSRRAVDRFAEAARLDDLPAEPDASLYRRIILADPVQCVIPEPVAEAAPVRTKPRTEPAAAAPAPAKPKPAPPAAPAKPASGGLSDSALGGVFR